MRQYANLDEVKQEHRAIDASWGDRIFWCFIGLSSARTVTCFAAATVLMVFEVYWRISGACR